MPLPRLRLPAGAVAANKSPLLLGEGSVMASISPGSVRPYRQAPLRHVRQPLQLSVESGVLAGLHQAEVALRQATGRVVARGTTPSTGQPASLARLATRRCFWARHPVQHRRRLPAPPGRNWRGHAPRRRRSAPGPTRPAPAGRAGRTWLRQVRRTSCPPGAAQSTPSNRPMALSTTSSAASSAAPGRRVRPVMAAAWPSYPG